MSAIESIAEPENDLLQGIGEIKNDLEAKMSPQEMICSMAKNGVSLEVIQEIILFREKLEEREALKAFNKAMSEFRGLVEPIEKTKKVAYNNTQYRYATLGKIERSISAACKKVGLSYRWLTEQKERSLKVTCIVSHAEGFSISCEMCSPYDQTGGKSLIHQIGSTQTYLQRYTLQSALGLCAEEDTDGIPIEDFSPINNNYKPKQSKNISPKKEYRKKELPQELEGSLSAILNALKANDELQLKETVEELTENQKQLLWSCTYKGQPCFSSSERQTLKEIIHREYLQNQQDQQKGEQ